MDRAAEGPDLPSGGNAQGLVVCGNEASQCQACKVKQELQCHLNHNVVKPLSFILFIPLMQNYVYTCTLIYMLSLWEKQIKQG